MIFHSILKTMLQVDKTDQDSFMIYKTRYDKNNLSSKSSLSFGENLDLRADPGIFEGGSNCISKWDTNAY